MSEAIAPLDQLSTSQTSWARCVYGAPLVALIFHGHASIKQACCNHWDCPSCGKERAKQEYRRVVWGAEVLEDEGHKLYFWTLTCRGKELDYETAMEHYYEWTNILLTNARAKSKREGAFWAYIQITEHQKKSRSHPHSHILTSFCPSDAVWFKTRKGVDAMASAWFFNANVSAGLGVQHQITQVKSASAVSRYIAKYLFKGSMTEQWPPKWKRIRYSQNWPRPPYMPAELAITLLTPADWKKAEDTQTEWTCEDDRIFEIAYHRLGNIRKRQSNLTF